MTLMLLSALTPRRYAVRIFTFSRVTCPPSYRAGSSVTRLSARSSRSAAAFARSANVIVSSSRAYPRAAAAGFAGRARYGQCREGGWILGRTYNGTQAEYARVPFADNSTYRLPDGVTDEEALMLADILPTGYEVGVLNGRIRPGDVVAVVGSGPIGLSAIMGARLFSPSRIVAIDVADGRLEAAKQFGAGVTVNSAHEDPVRTIGALTEGLGADVTIEAVGLPDTFELAVKLVRPGGRVANVGMHGKPAVLHLEEQWTRDITITTGQVDTFSTPTLLRLLASGQIAAGQFVTHRFGFDEFAEAYDVLARADDTGALKVVLSR